MSADFLRQYQLRATALEPRIEALVRGLSPQQLLAPPRAGGWSITQVFEHLCLAAESYDPRIEQALAAARRRTAAPRPFRGTFFGALLRKALMESNRHRMPAPRVWAPLTPRDRVTERLVAHTRTIAARLGEAEQLDARVMLASPLAWFLRMNVGEALAIEVVHTERHLGQAERARVAIGG